MIASPLIPLDCESERLVTSVLRQMRELLQDVLSRRPTAWKIVLRRLEIGSHYVRAPLLGVER